MQPELFQCWHTVYGAGSTFGQHCRINDRCISQQTGDIDPMLFYCRADRGPTFKQHWIIVGHVSYTVLAGWYCCASEAGQSTEGQSVLLSPGHLTEPVHCKPVHGCHCIRDRN